MNTDQARERLIRLFKPEYHRYIKTQLAGDFAIALMKKLEKKNNENKSSYGEKMTKEEMKDYDNINTRMNNAERIVREMWAALYGKDYYIANYHPNGELELESLDTWLKDHKWNL